VPASARVLANKVPQITLLFWVAKVLTTGMGETASDYLVTTIDPVLAVAAAFVVLVALLVLQLTRRRYVPTVYWATVAMVSVFGTMAADVVHVELGVPYAVSTAAFAVMLAVVFVVWWLVERDLSIHAITTRRRELFYWATVLVTFALGTAAGDWTATVLGLGYLASGIVFLACIAVPAIAYGVFRAAPIVTFWAAYVITRPLGASFADWIGVSPERGGLGLGTGPITLILLAGLVLAVTFMRGPADGTTVAGMSDSTQDEPLMSGSDEATDEEKDAGRDQLAEADAAFYDKKGTDAVDDDAEAPKRSSYVNPGSSDLAHDA
jgi:uncharacterized membrane-anchored protein